ncbi:MAG: class I SAM-dependent methyltransferase [Actinomycetota bacterium]
MLDPATNPRRSEPQWPDQTRTYGEQFHDVYDHFVPADSGRVVADAIAGRVSTVATDGRWSVVELGVGTGRVAIPLIDHGVDVHGIDSSAELLAVARRRAGAIAGRTASLELERADIRSWSPRRRYDAAICVCGTISMLGSEPERTAALRLARTSIHDRGVVIVETHRPSVVRRLHGHQQRLDFDFPAHGLSDVVAHSFLDGTRWEFDMEWPDGAHRRRTHEVTRLVEPDELVACAADVGLRCNGIYENWSDLQHGYSVEDTGLSPLYIVELEPRVEPDHSTTTNKTQE